MTYIEFIDMYPWADLFLELFKGIAPTLVALLAIWINNKSARARDKNSRIADLKLKMIWEVWESANELNDSISQLGALALTISEEDEELLDDFLNLGKSAITLRYQMRDKSRRYEFISDKNIGWKSYYDSASRVQEIVDELVPSVFNEESDTEEQKDSLTSELDRFSREYETYLEIVHSNIGNLTNS